MSKQWKPGDVAIWPGAAIDGGDLLLFRYDDDSSGLGEWMTAEEGGAYPRPTDVRPLVVIDPEDAEQMARLADLYDDLSPLDNPQGLPWEALKMQAALREFANPQPPKPDEPQGLGAVVLDGVGGRWVRSERHTGGVWDRPGEPTGGFRWDDIPAVRVLSEGVTP